MALELTGSIDALGGFTASQEFVGTASYALTASFALNAGGATFDTGSLLTTSSISGLTQSFTKGDGSTYENYITNAVSASFVDGASGGINFKTGFSGQLSASLGGEVTFDGQGGLFTQASGQEIQIGVLSNADLDVNSVTANAAVGFVGTASWAQSASYAVNFDTASLITTASGTNNVLTFTKGDASTFDITVQTGSIPSGTVSSSAQLPSGIFSGSSQIDFITASSIVNAETSSTSQANGLVFTKGDGTTINLLQDTSSFVKSVNTLTPNAQGNVAVAFGSVETGTSASMLAYSSSGNFNDADIWIISGESGSLSGSNGDTFIFASSSGQLLEISPTDQISNDARYVNVTGDTMTGDLILNADPTDVLGATPKQYVDPAYTGSIITSASSGEQTLTFRTRGGASETISWTSASYSVSSSLSQKAINADLATTASYVTASNVGGPHGASSVVTSSYAVTASHALNVPLTASFAITSSHAITASYVDSSSYAVTSSHAITASYVESSSYAVTASHALNVPLTASFALTSSFITASDVHGIYGTSSVDSASFASSSVSASKVDKFNALSDLNEHSDDDAAADAGVPIGGLYRNGNFVLIRIGGTGTDTHYLTGFSNTNFIDLNGALSGFLNSGGPWSFGFRSVGLIADSTDNLATMNRTGDGLIFYQRQSATNWSVGSGDAAGSTGSTGWGTEPTQTSVAYWLFVSNGSGNVTAYYNSSANASGALSFSNLPATPTGDITFGNSVNTGVEPWSVGASAIYLANTQLPATIIDTAAANNGIITTDANYGDVDAFITVGSSTITDQKGLFTSAAINGTLTFTSK